MKKITILILLLFNFQNIYSQYKKIIYVNEHYQPISFVEYQDKLESEIFDNAILKTDSVIYKKLRYRQYFGKIDDRKIKQLTKLLHKKYNLNPNKTWLIHYVDSIPSFSDFTDEELNKLENKNSILKDPLISKEHKNSSVKSFVGHSRCVTSPKITPKQFFYISIKEREVIDDKIELVHFYNKNERLPVEILNHYNYYQDYNSIIRKIFSDGMQMYKLLILKPNGEFYVARRNVCSARMAFKLIQKDKFYEKQKKKWQKELAKLD